MSNAITSIDASVRPDNSGLDKLLIAMARYGRPRVGMYGTGWHCGVDMNTNTTGTSFEVKSDFGMPSPLSAAIQCSQRIEAALKQLNKEPQ